MEKGLKLINSFGRDEIYPEVLKLINDENLILLIVVLNRIYETGSIAQY